MEETLTLEKKVSAKNAKNNITEKYLSFVLDDQLFAMHGDQIIEILSMQPVTFMPNLPNYIKGVVNIRGKIIPLIDLRLRFGKDPIEYDDKTCIILVEIDDINAGLIVDNVKDVLDISVQSLRPITKISGDESFNHFATNMCNIENDTLIVLSAKNIFSSEFA